VAHKAKHRKHSALQCSECSYATDNKQNFDRHRENHEARHMYQCQFCSFSSTKEAAITRHVQTSHENNAENMQILTQGINYNEPNYVA
jgi:ribosomal protein S26